MNSTLPVIETHRFQPADFVGGDAALDFINTVTGRDQAPRDWLDSYARLLEWAAGAGLLPEKVLRALARRANADPAAAGKALARAKTLRESAFAVLAALAAGREPPPEPLEVLRAAWLAGVAAHELRFSGGRVVPALSGDAADLDLISALVAFRLVEHVLPGPPERLRLCAGPSCSWLFLDTSKAGRRRWCDMAVCGNAAKSRRHYARVRAGS